MNIYFGVGLFLQVVFVSAIYFTTMKYSEKLGK